MKQATSPLNDLIRKVDSDYYDPKLYGDGFIITWHNKKLAVTNNPNIIGKLFTGRNLQYYFVKTQIKPIVIKGLEFKWEEGTSDISLDFDAIFKLKVTNRHEANQLVTVLSQAGNAEKGIYQLIDKYLHITMSELYEQVVKENNNLLDKFYQGEIKRGECEYLNKQVSKSIQLDLSGSDFNIGFTLINAPKRHADFKYQSPISDTDLKVDSECQLTLTNYQSYRKSGINSNAQVEAHMKEAIDSAIKQHIIGKSPMELLSNFKCEKNGQESISELVRISVERQAQAIGYDLKSFHTLPQSAPLKLLSGIMVELNESDATFKTGHFGGSIRLNIRMEVKAIDGQSDKYKHLFHHSQKNNSENGSKADKQKDASTQFLNIREEDIVNQIKQPIIAACQLVIRNHTHLEVTTKFDSEIREKLEESITSSLRDQHGLEAIIKAIQPRESEEASRLQELLHKKRPISFKFTSRTGTIDTPLITINGGFEVTGLDINYIENWTKFESHDFGYRTDSPERTKTTFKPAIPVNANDQLIDRLWKNHAIESELASIEDEIIRYFKSSNLFVVDLNHWINSPKENREMQSKLLTITATEIKTSRGLDIKLEPFAIIDEDLNKARENSRKIRLENILKTEETEARLRTQQAAAQEADRQKLSDAIINKKIDFIDEQIEDFDDITVQQETLTKQYKQYTEKSTSLSAIVPKTADNGNQKNHLLSSVFLTEENESESNNENNT